jgi:hypothetical protein
MSKDTPGRKFDGHPLRQFGNGISWLSGEEVTGAEARAGAVF